MTRKRDPKTGKILIEGVHPIVSPRTGVVTYRARYTYESAGKRRHASRTFADADAATAWLYARRLEVDRDRHTDVDTLTVADYFTRWRERREREVSPGRALSLRYAWESHFAPVIGHVRLQRVTRAQVQGCVDALERAGLARNTVNLYAGVLRAMFDDAVRDGLIPSSPAVSLSYTKNRAPARSTWTPLQMRAFLRSVRDEPDAALWHFLAATGCRIGEALALAWRDVDLDAGTARMHRTLAVDGSGAYAIRSGTKTRERGRVIPLPASLCALLREISRTGDTVFTDTRGEPLKPRTLQKRFPRLADRAGLPRIRIHDIRHSVASAMIADGVEAKIVQELLGHSSIATTLNTYAHVSTPTLRRGTDALDRLFGVAHDNTAGETGRSGG